MRLSLASGISRANELFFTQGWNFFAYSSIVLPLSKPPLATSDN
jgi:hypothetical protein